MLAEPKYQFSIDQAIAMEQQVTFTMTTVAIFPYSDKALVSNSLLLGFLVSIWYSTCHRGHPVLGGCAFGGTGITPVHTGL